MTRRPALAAALLVLLVLAACSSPGQRRDDSAARPSATRATTSARPSATTGPAGTRGAAPSPTRSSTAEPAAAWWHPRAGTPWQWQLSGTVDTSVDVPVYDIDGFENSAAVVSRLHAAGRKVICYVNAGAWESFRPDAKAFPSALLGGGDGWNGERWLDIRAVARLRPLMAARFDMCRSKGFDAVEPDLLDGYTNTTGFPLTAADQLAYNRMIAALAHQRGMAVGLKNDLDQVDPLVRDFDFSVDEQCAQYKECPSLSPFIAAGKPVFHVEYELKAGQFCAATKRLGFSSMVKRLALDAWRQPC